MPSGVRANSLLLVGTPSGLVRSLDEAVEFLDRDGVPRRRVSGVDTNRLLLRGSSLSSLDIARVVHSHDQDNKCDDDDDALDDETSQQDVDAYAVSLDEKLALERARQAKMVRRQRLLLELKDSKRKLLLDQHEKLTERITLWHEALALDPDAELTTAHTALSPSSKARAFIDGDGNVRRKSITENEESSSHKSAFRSGGATATAIASLATVTAATPRKSLMLEFMQTLLED